MVEKYVEDGTLRIEWRDFPYQGQESVNAALAARAAQAQGKFWEYHDLLYASQSGVLSEDVLYNLAREVGLDMEKFESDLTNARYAEAINEDFQEGQRQGITGTPGFILNGQVIVGLQPPETFGRLIEEAKLEAESG